MAALSLVLSGCKRTEASFDAGAARSATTTTTDPPAQAGGEVAFGLDTDPNGLDPVRNTWDSAGIQVASALFDPLVAFGADGSVQPYLAERVSHSPDYLAWTVVLRPGVRFHDGSPLTADTLVAGTRAVLASPIVGKAAANTYHAERIDDLTVRYDLRKPQSVWPASLTSQVGFVASAGQLAAPDGQSKPMGTGPFTLQSWVPGKELRLVRNPHYWRHDAKGVQLPYLDAVNFKINADTRSRIDALERGDLDVLQTRSDTAGSLVNGLAGQSGIEVHHDGGATESAFILLNTAKPPLDDVRVRQALAYATDRTKISDDLQWDKALLVDGPFAPSSPWYAADVHQRGYDLDRARRLVADYTRETGHDVTFELAGHEGSHTIHAIAEAWTAAGVHVNVTSVDTHKAAILMVLGQYDAALMSYFAAPDPDVFWPFWHSSTVTPIGEISINFPRLADPEIDAALDLGRASPDPAVRKGAYATVQRRFDELVPYVWLLRLDWMVANRPNVHQARNVTLPDGSAAMPYNAGQFRLTETWIDN